MHNSSIGAEANHNVTILYLTQDTLYNLYNNTREVMTVDFFSISRGSADNNSSISLDCGLLHCRDWQGEAGAV